jgi:hypothetical protein
MPRPPFDPTPELRALVKSMAAVGTPQEKIAQKISIRSPKTLRKYFPEELRLGAIDANYKVSKTLFEMATSGNNLGATIYWDKTRGCQQERRQNKGATVAPPFVVAREPEGGQQ